MRKPAGLLACAMLVLFPAAAQERPEIPCFWRPTSLSEPWLSALVPCMEHVAWLDGLDATAFTSLAMTDDGTLYGAVPGAGQIYRFADRDDDGLPETGEVWLDGLIRPTALAVYDSTLYIHGGDGISVVEDGERRLLVDGVPGQAVFPGGMAVGQPEFSAEPRIFIGVGASDESAGVILSYALDGAGPDVVATGLHRPAELALWRGYLYVTDHAPLSAGAPDEINQVRPGADFGYPGCHADTACAGVTSPVFMLPPGSRPTGLAGYDGTGMPALNGHLLVTLGGIDLMRETAGYQIASANLETGALLTLSPQPATPDDPRFRGLTPYDLNWRGVGLFPLRPLDIIVDRRGWAFIAVATGRILAFRPQSEIVY